LNAAGKKEPWQNFIYSLESAQYTQLKMLELDSKEPLPSGIRSSADILQHIIEKKLMLHTHDKDMIIMQHEIEYKDANQKEKKLTSTLIVKGTDQDKTAMAKTVGLPLGIAAKLILDGRITLKGLKMPIEKEIYEPVLEELKLSGIEFHENEA
jgi:saccharopine dehydrogenase (NADP+, L-glutamate forming)